MRGISKVAERNGFACWQAYAPDKNNGPALEHDIVIESYNVRRMNELYSRLTGMRGFQAYFSTKAFLKRIDRIKPDIIHVHNLHNNYIHVGLLFDYIKNNHIKVIWTLHDCWPFTGRCPHFQITGCNRWRTGCHDCPYPKDEYPSVRYDRTSILWKRKKNSFTGVEDLTIVTPSHWLASLVEQSFLSKYPLRVINNGINLDVFKPSLSNFRKNYQLEGKFIILGVSFAWEKRKGIDVFARLATTLDDRYQIVLIGTDETIDKTLPSKIISIHRTSNQNELCDIYSAADVLINPTREDNFPTVNIESLACGTPVITFKTGGSPEIIDSLCGIVINQEDYEGLMTAIEDICERKIINRDNCSKRANKYDRAKKFQEYVELYQAICCHD